MVDLLQVECVEAIMRTGSFRRAANEVYLSQPSVSAHIAKLERELGLTLFQRGSDGTKLTSQGERILPHLRAFTAAATAIRQASDHITVHRTPTLTVYSYRTGLMEIMPPALRVLNESFDPMQARVIEASHADMVAGLVQGKCDLAIDAGINATTGDDPGIDAALLVDIGPTVLIGRHGHPLLDDDGWIDPAEIVNVPIVMPVSLEPFMLPLLPESAGRRLTLAHDPLSTMAIFDAGAELAIVGISLRIVADPNLRRRPIRGAPHVRCMAMTAQGAVLSPPAAALHSYLIAWGEFQQQSLLIDPEHGSWRARYEPAVVDRQFGKPEHPHSGR